MTVILSSLRHNLSDQDGSNIKVIATPYTPAVIAAIDRMSQLKKHWSDIETEHQIDTALAYQANLMLDWQTNRLVDRHGNYVKGEDQFEALQFLVSLRNNSWPCAVPVIIAGGEVTPLAKTLSDWPCYTPDITDLDRRIFLLNDNGDSLRPRYVWGRRNNELTSEETLVVRFDLKQGETHFLRGTDNIYFVITDFDGPIRFTYPITLIKQGLNQIAAE